MTQINMRLALLPSELPGFVSKLAGAYSADETMLIENGYLRSGHIAIVPIMGILFHDDDMFGTSYRQIRAAFNGAVADPDVRLVALMVNSPGGEVSGCFDLAEEIYAARETKPIVAILAESAYSAAYALASAADTIFVPRTGGTGSIGVVSMHLDLTKALEQQGIKVTTVQYGARKTEQYPTSELSAEARNAMQEEVNMLGEMFVGLVARNRGVSQKSVRNTEAGTYLGQAGVDIGLADVVASPQQAFNKLQKKIR